MGSLKTFSRLCLFIFIFLSILSTEQSLAAKPQRNSILQNLDAVDAQIKTIKASLQIGIPHPTIATLIQWTDGLVAYRKTPEFVYVKGYQPLVPVYFQLKSSGGNFTFFIPRVYKTYRGENKIFETSIDLDIKFIPQDILFALRPVRIDPQAETEWKLTQDAKAFELTVRTKDGKPLRKIIVDPENHPRYQLEFNEAGYPYLEIIRDDWRTVSESAFPFDVKIKRLLPKKNELLLKFKEIRPNVALEEKLFQDNFPKDAKSMELKDE